VFEFVCDTFLCDVVVKTTSRGYDLRWSSARLLLLPLLLRTQPPTVSWDGKISTGQSVVTLCGLGVKAGMAHSTCGCTCWWQVKLCDPSLTHAVSEHLRDELLSIRCYANVPFTLPSLVAFFSGVSAMLGYDPQKTVGVSSTVAWCLWNCPTNSVKAPLKGTW